MICFRNISHIDFFTTPDNFICTAGDCGIIHSPVSRNGSFFIQHGLLHDWEITPHNKSFWIYPNKTTWPRSLAFFAGVTDAHFVHCNSHDGGNDVHAKAEFDRVGVMVVPSHWYESRRPINISGWLIWIDWIKGAEFCVADGWHYCCLVFFFSLLKRSAYSMYLPT